MIKADCWVVTWECATGSIEGETGGVVSLHKSEAGAIAAAWEDAREWDRGDVGTITVPVRTPDGRLEQIVLTDQADPEDPSTWSYDEAGEWDICVEVVRWEVEP